MPKINTSQVFNYAIAAVAVSILPIAAHAKQCDANGGVRFLGTGASGGQSVWISGTSAGAFRLEAAQGNQTVDTWSKNRRGLHVSLSPVVSSGNGGTHKLYSSDDCLLDTQNQKNGFVFPPNIIPPGISRPPLNRPLTPTVPGGVKPPIGALPTAPITPTVPGGVTPPIGTLPVSPDHPDGARRCHPTNRRAAGQPDHPDGARRCHPTNRRAARSSCPCGQQARTRT